MSHIDLWARRRIAELEQRLMQLTKPDRLAVLYPLVYQGSPGQGQALAIAPDPSVPRSVKAVDGVLVNGKFRGALQERDNPDMAWDDDWPVDCWILDLAGRSSLTAGGIFNGFYSGIEGGGPYYLALVASAGKPLDDEDAWLQLQDDVDLGDIPAWAAGSYQAGRLVTADEATWVSTADTTGTPGSSEDWTEVTPTNAGVYSGALAYPAGACVLEALATYATGDPDVMPTITTPDTHVETAPFVFTSTGGSIDITGDSDHTVNFEVDGSVYATIETPDDNTQTAPFTFQVVTTGTDFAITGNSEHTVTFGLPDAFLTVDSSGSVTDYARGVVSDADQVWGGSKTLRGDSCQWVVLGSDQVSANRVAAISATKLAIASGDFGDSEETSGELYEWGFARNANFEWCMYSAEVGADELGLNAYSGQPVLQGFQGTWSDSTGYTAGQSVFWDVTDGGLFVAKVTVPAGTLPSDSSYWSPLGNIFVLSQATNPSSYYATSPAFAISQGAISDDPADGHTYVGTTTTLADGSQVNGGLVITGPTTTTFVAAIDGDSGSADGSTLTISGGTTDLTFTGSGSTLTLGGTLSAANGGTGVDSASDTGIAYVNSGSWEFLTVGTGLTISGGALEATGYTFADSVADSGGTVSLVNDASSPGDSYYYGTNSGGTKGWYALPSWSLAIGDAVGSSTHYDVLSVDGSGNLAEISPATAGYVLTSNGTGSAASFQALPSYGGLTFIDSLDNSSGTVSLVNDASSPGDSYYYGTDSSGTKGWYTLPGGGSGITTIDGDSGSATGSTITVSGGSSGLTTAGSSSTLTIEGTLAVGSGGTDRTSLTAHAVLVGAGTSAVSEVGPATAGDLFIAQGASSDPAFHAVSGDVSMTSSGAFTVVALQGNAVSSSAPTSGQVLTWNSSTSEWTPTTPSGSSYTFADSLSDSGGTVSLVNDASSPGDSYYYGTNSGGTKGWYALPSYTFADSLSDSGGTVSLVNDASSPGDSYYYGTNSGGSKGWYALPTWSLALGDSIGSGSAYGVLFADAGGDLDQDATHFYYEASELYLYNAKQNITNNTGTTTLVLDNGVNTVTFTQSSGTSLYCTGGDVYFGAGSFAINGVTYAWPSSGSTVGVLTNDGSGNLSWSLGIAEGTLTYGSTISWDIAQYPAAAVTLTGNATLSNPTGLASGTTQILRVIQDSTGSRTLSYGSAYKWPGGTAPTLSTGAGAIDILTFYCDGSYLYGVAQLNFEA